VNGLHVAITGASSGIGEALARELAKAGAKLTLVARRKELLEAIGGGACLCAHDLSDPSRAAEWLPSAEAANGPVDVLVNNAGMDLTGPSLELTPEETRRLLDLNLHSPLALIRAVAPGMVARGRGAIVNVASAAAFASTPRQAWYGASKAGLASFSEALRYELAPSGVHVLTVYPGPVRTPMAERAFAAVGGREKVMKGVPEGEPGELAVLIRRALERRQARVIYPRFYRVSYLAPWFARWMKARRVMG
jgi:short-subunit dehydrogenase